MQLRDVALARRALLLAFAVFLAPACSAVTPTSTQEAGENHSATPPSTAPVSAARPSGRIDLRGAYTFHLVADPDGTCEWPVTTFAWPVQFTGASHSGEILTGSLVFPSAGGSASTAWRIQVGNNGIELQPGKQSPGPAAAAYNLVVEGGRWEAAALRSAAGGRQEIAGGTATGARLTLVLPGSQRAWECRSDAAWSLLVRHVDLD